MESKADVNAVDSDGRTALHGAAHKGRTTVVQLLVDHGARVTLCPYAAQGMGHSLAWGIRAAPVAKGWLVALADRHLGRRGRMSAAIETMGFGIGAYEAEPFALDLG